MGWVALTNRAIVLSLLVCSVRPPSRHFNESGAVFGHDYPWLGRYARVVLSLATAVCGVVWCVMGDLPCHIDIDLTRPFCSARSADPSRTFWRDCPCSIAETLPPFKPCRFGFVVSLPPGLQFRVRCDAAALTVHSSCIVGTSTFSKRVTLWVRSLILPLHSRSPASQLALSRRTPRFACRHSFDWHAWCRLEWR